VVIEGCCRHYGKACRLFMMRYMIFFYFNLYLFQSFRMCKKCQVKYHSGEFCACCGWTAAGAGMCVSACCVACCTIL